MDQTFLSRAIDDAWLRQDLGIIHRNASQVSTLIDDVLDRSQIDANRMGLEKSELALSQIVVEAIASDASLYDPLGLTIAVELPAELPPLYVDGNRIRQILINLLNNAARFTEKGGVTIRATSDESEVVVSVTDTETGVAPADVPFIFQEPAR